MTRVRERSSGARRDAWRAGRMPGAGRGAVAALALMLAASVCAQQQPIYYPAQGQSPQKQQNDVAQCRGWATQTTGVDPVVLAQRSANQPPPPGQQGDVLRGAAGGAALGAAVGAIAGNAGTGAAIGAVTGTAAGGLRQRRQTQAYNQQEAAMQQSTANQLATFNRAVTACMNGRGYTSQ
jgi:hypothetical protein